jgi:hypothetical protein
MKEDMMSKVESSTLRGASRQIPAGRPTCAPLNGEPEPPVTGRPLLL